MQRLLERLDRKLRWTLIAPQSGHTASAGPCHPVLLQRVQQLRVAVGLTPDEPQTRHAFSAAGVWHLIACDAADEIAGTVRLIVIDRRHEPLEPADIPVIGHVAFPSDRVRDQHLLALQGLFDEKAGERYFIAPGGLFTTPAWRGSGLAAALGAAAIAMARLHDCRFSASYTVVRGQAQELFTTFGGRPPVRPDGQPLEAFLCPRHGCAVRLLIFDSRDSGPRAEAGVQLLQDRMARLMPREVATA